MAKNLGGKRTRTVEVVEELPGERQEEPGEELDEDLAEQLEGQQLIDDEIEELVGGEDREGFVKLMRFNPDKKKWLGLPSMPRTGFSRDLVAETWGGGLYSMRVYKGKAYKGGKKFEIDPAVKPTRTPEPDAVAVNNNDPIRLLAMALLQKMQQPPPPPPVVDPMAMIEKLATTMRALTPPPAPAPPPPPPPTSLRDQLDMIKSVVEVGTTIIDARGDSGGGSGDAYMGVVSKLAEPVIELVKTQAMRERGRIAAPRRAALPPATGPVPDQPVAAPAPAGGVPQMPWLLEIQRWLPLIQKRQQKGLSAESTAFFVLDELSENTLTALAELAAQDGFEEQVKKILPAEMQQPPEWVGEFLIAVKDYLFEDAETEPEGGMNDLDAEAQKRLALLKDKEPEQSPEQGP